MRLFAPFTPFVAEEVWSWWQSGSIHLAPWPSVDEITAVGDSSLLDPVAAVLERVRGAKSEAKASMKATLSDVVITAPAEMQAQLQTLADDLRAVGGIVGEVTWVLGDAFALKAIVNA